MRVLIDTKTDTTFILEYDHITYMATLTDKKGNELKYSYIQELPIDLHVFLVFLHNEFIILD
jgi:hypothetical protein